MKWHALTNFDLAMMTELWNRSFEDYFVAINLSEEDFLHRMESLNLSSKQSLVVEFDDEHAGMVLYGEEKFKNQQTAWIGGMGIIKALRQHGIGKEMLKKTIEIAKEDSVDALHLEVIIGNERAERLYRKEGFDVVNRVGVGTLAVLPSFRDDEKLTLKSTSITDEHRAYEMTGTPWQNRLNRNYQLYAIMLQEHEIGYLYWIEEGYALKQLVFYDEHKPMVEAVLAELYKRFGAIQLAIGNYNIEDTTYDDLLELGMKEKLRQYHMALQLTS
ncbi:GNAT family N-acetyltransferase [Kurthia sibirica]|uniref:N-acetyltransferase domain-containing protein n=1 Tax=Kurthia sibirica TaxID=202750 RepID=A0A2U3AMF8_9BACL|nr:GNAT family N-acetyltransferase [Kurthia sibirica]PWI25702.1 hypothetical protein DEX24_07270 [Kurthia sibirica]GEK33707.1 hypothetical protein KSI01_12400 [Kurthia sibirica]